MWQGKPSRITAQSVTRAELPAIQDHYTRRCQEEGPKRCERLQQPTTGHHVWNQHDPEQLL